MPQNYNFRSDTCPARSAVAVTPSDTLFISSGTATDDGKFPRALYIGTTGNLSVVMADGGTALFTAVPVGPFAIAVKRVNATGTTAAAILALD